MSLNLNPNFYTYLWLREDGTPYYVGKGIGDRAFRRGSPTFTSCDGYLTVSDMSRILLHYHPTEEAAFAAEIFLISYYGKKKEGGILVNISDGGSGGATRTGIPQTSETRIKIGKANHLRLRGRKLTSEHRAHISQGQEGRKLPQEWVDNMSKVRVGKPHPYKLTSEGRQRKVLASRVAATKRWAKKRGPC